ncbi:TonB-dependent siderophore receptor [Achromobacter seleniivolatilans]|uniref:TonB-dependent siderophore receptor n=1 Tax=Achromobacter seleniivolatilans TaxID=3047478 RepID=A0ABY9M780_9BURK|nr:TonB-dependent receptor [Achromobacter sp. R39]WMD22429.1 TonB-dependent siderophore receptor [Achromobacter sp. R39]
MSNTRRWQGCKLAVIHLALAATPWQTQAQGAPAAVTAYAIAAGPLESVLNQYAEQAGLALSYDPAFTRDLRSPGLNGTASVDAAFGQILSGTGLSAVRTAERRYTLQRNAAQAGPVQLEAVTVTGSGVPQPSEGTDSYTTAATNTATRLNLSLRETPQSISIITRQRIDDQSLNSINAVLAQTPGISVQNMGSERFNVLSRGYAIDSYQIDGVPTIVEVGTQDVSPSLADMAIYDRVEVLRGAAGLMSGAGEPSGTLNMIRKRPTREFQGHVTAGAGSWDLYRAEADLSGPLNASGSVRGRAVAAYQQNRSFIDYYQQKRQVFYGIVEADLTDSTLLTAGVDHQRNQPRGSMGGLGVPLFFSNGKQMDLDRSTNVASRNNFFDVDATNVFMSVDQKLANDWSVKFSANRLESQRDFQTVMASVSSGFANEQTGFGMPLWIQGGDSRQVQNGLDLHIEGPYTLWGRRHDFVMGLSFTESQTLSDVYRDTSGYAARNPFNLYTWGNQAVSPNLVKNYDNDTYTRESGGYVATRLRPTDALSLIAGARISSYKWDYRQAFADPASAIYDQALLAKKDNVITPYAGIVYDIDAVHSVYASYTSIYKPQYYRDRTGAALAPRDGVNYEAGLKSEWFAGALNSSLSIFQVRQNNLAVADDGYTVPGTDNVAAYRAVPGARTNGVDMELIGEVLPGWNVAASYTYSRTEDSTGARIKTVMPEHIAKLWTTYRLPDAWNRLTVGGGVNWQSAMHYSVTPWQLKKTVTARQDAYAVVNLMARYDFSRQVSATLNVNNLFDKKYLNSLDTTFNTGYYGAPRNAMLNVRYAF